MTTEHIIKMGNDTSQYTATHLPQYTSFGCYTLVYSTPLGDDLCAECALDSLTQTDVDPNNLPSEIRQYDEGPVIECVDCGKELESSYGAVDEDPECLQDAAQYPFLGPDEDRDG